MRLVQPPYDFDALHALLLRCFADMERRIDPPSSVTRLTAAGLARTAQSKEIWVIEDSAGPVACMILTLMTGTVYVSKLAVAPEQRRQGLAAQLLSKAEDRARDLGLPAITLQTRRQLIENQRLFTRLGFRRVGSTTHPGHDSATSWIYSRPVSG